MNKKYFLSFVIAALVLPASAQARTCLDAYYVCLNNTYKTKGLERVIADIACATSYYGCLRNDVV